VSCSLLQLPFNPGNQLIPLPVYLILGIKKGAPPLLIPPGLHGLDLFLAGQLVLQGQGHGGSPAGLLNLPVQFLSKESDLFR
jgi:hypothetical protein